MGYFLADQLNDAVKTSSYAYDDAAGVTAFIGRSLSSTAACGRFMREVEGPGIPYDPAGALLLVSNWPSRDPIGEAGSISWFERYFLAEEIKRRVSGFTDADFQNRLSRASLSYVFTPSEILSERNLYAMLGNSPVNGYDYLGQLSCLDLGNFFNPPSAECGNIDGFYRHCVNTCLLNRCTFGILGNGVADLLTGDLNNDAPDTPSDREASELGDAIGDSDTDCESGCASELTVQHALYCCQSSGLENRNKDDPQCCSQN